MSIPVPLVVLVAFIGLAFCSCQKFEEGPAFSLRTKTFRATNTWYIDKATKNGIDIKQETRMGVDLQAEGVMVFTDTIATAAGDEVTTENGVWEFGNDGETLLLVFTIPGGGVSSVKAWDILRLTSTELWVTEIDNDDIYRYQFATE